jgi:hypothetical protein
MDWDLEKVRRLAPDLLTFERSEKLVKPSRWKELGQKGSLIWGQCRSGGLTWYKAGLELDKERSFSNSPSSVLPDKYVLALATYFLKFPTRFPEREEPPAWVGEGFRRQHQKREEPSTQRANKKVQARERARQKRLLLMYEGLSDLERWLDDVAREGLGAWQQRDDTAWEAIATRMTDQKLNGPARRIRRMASLRSQPDWLDLLTCELADLYLFAQAFQQLDEYEEAFQAELLNQAGINTRKSDLLDETGLSDYWLVLSRQEGEDEKLRYRRVWLWGEEAQRPALLLDFAWGDQPYEHDWRVGAAVEAELVYYPGVLPHRAIVKNFSCQQRPFARLKGQQKIADFLRDTAQQWARNPWMVTAPSLLADVVPVLDEQAHLYIKDSEDQLLPLAADPASWKLLAAYRAEPMLVFGEWNGQHLQPFMTLANRRIVRLHYDGLR